MSPRLRVAGRSTAHHAPHPAAATSLALVALFTVGSLPGYLAPVIVSRLIGHSGLTAAQAGVAGSALLLASACAGIALAGRVAALGQGRLARLGLVLLLIGAATAGTAPPGQPRLLVTGCLLGGLGAGTAAAVAATGIAAAAEPHRTSVRGLLATSGTASLLYLLLPRLGQDPALPFLALLLLGVLAFPLTLRLPAGPARRATEPAPPRLPRRGAGLALVASLALWSLAQNALWAVSAQIGLHQACLTERRLGLVLALALGGGLLGVLAADALGDRAGRALPVGAGTAAIAVCVTVSTVTRSASGFAGGEVLWNGLYPLVLSYLIGAAAALDPAGRWTVLAGCACALGLAGGPLTGATLTAWAGYRWLGAALGGVLLLTAVPLTLVARTAARAAEPPPEGTTQAGLPAQRPPGDRTPRS
ncbi:MULTISPECIES: MFS transporter [Kitasatospora]|uniref:MFS transporter n=1 Tax=Kitasatospora TaxID=2063 RepID=UPI000CC0BF2C|nr:MFS transporter [Kitasatospora sp. GP30]MDH6145592.1 MFS family permease [Kitasatospora sp. GP30]